MSFILDALKKSEIERQRQTVPGLMDPRIAERRSRLPIWAIALGILLAINLAVLSFMLLRKSPPAAHAAPPAQASRAAVADNPAPAPEHFSPLDTAPVYAPEIPVAAPDGAAPAVPSAAKTPMFKFRGETQRTSHLSGAVKAGVVCGALPSNFCATGRSPSA